MFVPKSFDTFRHYTRDQFTRDGVAGLIVGIVSLPLAIAFAIASGATPDKGLYTAVVAGFIISAFGGSRVQIGGPTGAFVVIVYAIIQQYGYNGLLVSTMMAGVILALFGLFKLGSVIKFIPYSVITGFTFGIACLIALGQLPDFLGLGLTNLPADAPDKVRLMAASLHLINPWAFAVALFTLGAIWLSGKITGRVPGSLLALALSSLAVWAFGLPVETIGSRFGAIPSSLPVPHLPDFSFSEMRQLLRPALTIAILGAIESLLSAVVADGMIGSRHRSNMELVAQGAANIVSPLFGGLPATGAIARTATNVKNGGRTPAAGIISALTLLAIMSFFGGLVAHIPLACLAGILMSVAYHMSEWPAVAANIRGSRSAAAVTIVTISLTVLVDLTMAIEVGIFLAAVFFMRGMSAAASVRLVKAVHDADSESETDYAGDTRLAASLPAGAMLYEVSGPMFFGAVYKFKEALQELNSPPAVLVLKFSHVPFIDSSGINALREAVRQFNRSGTKFVFCGVLPEVMARLNMAGFTAEVGAHNFVRNSDAAVKRAGELLRAA